MQASRSPSHNIRVGALLYEGMMTCEEHDFDQHDRGHEWLDLEQLLVLVQVQIISQMRLIMSLCSLKYY